MSAIVALILAPLFIGNNSEVEQICRNVCVDTDFYKVKLISLKIVNQNLNGSKGV